MDATGTPGVQQQIDGLPEAAQQHWQLILAHARSEPLAEAEALHLLHVCLEQEATGLRLEWGSICAGIASLSRLDDGALKARLIVGFSQMEFRWQLVDCQLFTWHQSSVRFARCLPCMVAKQGQCGSQSATWLCRTRITDAAAGQPAATGAALRPKRTLAQQMARGKQSEGVNLEEFDTACISMFDPNTWPQTRRDETFVTQANKLWTFLTEVMPPRDRLQLWLLVNRACTKRYLNYMGMLWERASAPEAKASVDRYAMGLTAGRTAAAAAGSSLGSEAAAAAAVAKPSSAGWSAGQRTAEAAYLAAMEQMRGMVTASPVQTSSGESPNRATGTQGLQQPAAPAPGDQEPWRAHVAKQQPAQAPWGQALGRAAQGPGQQQAAASSAWPQALAELEAVGAAASSNLAAENWLLPSPELLARLRQEMDFYEEESATPGTPSSLASAPSSTLSAPGQLVVAGTSPREAYAGLRVGDSPTTQSLAGSGLATPVPVSPGELSPMVSTPAGSVAGGLRSRRPWHWMPEMQELGYEKQVLPKGLSRATRKRLRHPQASQELLAQVGSAGRVRRSGRARRAVTFANDSDSDPEDIDSGWSGDDKELKPTRRSSLGPLNRVPRAASRSLSSLQGARPASAPASSFLSSRSGTPGARRHPQQHELSGELGEEDNLLPWLDAAVLEALHGSQMSSSPAPSSQANFISLSNTVPSVNAPPAIPLQLQPALALKSAPVSPSLQQRPLSAAHAAASAPIQALLRQWTDEHEAVPHDPLTTNPAGTPYVGSPDFPELLSDIVADFGRQSSSADFCSNDEHVQ